MNGTVKPAGDLSAVSIEIDGIILAGELGIPADARAGVLFVHDGGDSQQHRFVAGQLRGYGIATLVFGLRAPGEEPAGQSHDVDLLAERIAGVADWLARQPAMCKQPIGLFGAGVGAAAALVAAAARPALIGAVVSRGGQIDMAGIAMSRVQAPTLLIVGGNDYPVIGMNRDALQFMCCERGLEVVPGATHLFEQTGALETVARLARDWFRSHLLPGQQVAVGAVAAP